MTQKEMIMLHLINKGSINPKEALELYGVMRLAAIIHNIRKEGYIVQSDITESENRFGTKVFFATYRLGGRDVGNKVD